MQKESKRRKNNSSSKLNKYINNNRNKNKKKKRSYRKKRFCNGFSNPYTYTTYAHTHNKCLIPYCYLSYICHICTNIHGTNTQGEEILNAAYSSFFFSFFF